MPIAQECHLAGNMNIVLTYTIVMLLSFAVNLFFAEIIKWCMLGENHVPYVFAADG
jgi:hypothetical protein